MSSEWNETTLGDVIEIKHGLAFKGEYFRDTPPGDVLLTPGNFRIGGGFQAGKEKYYDGPVASEYILAEGDFLVTMTDLSRDTATLGYPALVPKQEGGRFLHNQRLGKISIQDRGEMDKRFLYYLMCSRPYRHEILASATGTTVKHTSPIRILRFRFNCPPLETQRYIAHILGTLDDKIELNRRMNRTLEAIARAIFKSWFIDFDPVIDNAILNSKPIPDEFAQCTEVRREILGRNDEGMPGYRHLFPDNFQDSPLGQIPKGWEVGLVGDLGEVSGGKRPDVRFPRPSRQAAVPLWGGNGPMAFVTVPLINEPILLTGRVGTLGSVFRVVTPCWPSDNTLILRPRKQSYFEYLFLQLQKIDFLSLNRGSTQPLLTQSDLKKQVTLLPQKELLDHFSEFTGTLYERIEGSDAASRTLAALRDALLPKLISGKLEVLDTGKSVEEGGL